MYLVKIKNGATETTIHQVATSNLINDGSIKKEINKIEKFDFIIYPNNAGYDLINDLTTQITVTNTKTSTLEFIGRVLKTVKNMDSDGLVYKSVTCENALGYLCDSIQYYAQYSSYTVTEYLTAVLNNHNLQVETYKKIYIGAVTLTDVINVTSTYKKTFEEIKENLIEKLGGELLIRQAGGLNYLDYKTTQGTRITATKIELTRNMKAMSIEKDTMSIITRLIPLGSKINGTEQRTVISSVNSGIPYLEDTDAQAELGVVTASYIFDDITDPTTLKNAGQAYLNQNNYAKTSYNIDALDLSLIGLDVNSFDLYNEYLVVNSLLGINEYLRVISKTININNPHESKIEIGDKKTTLTDIVMKSYDYVTYQLPVQKNDWLEIAKNNASALINTATTGYLVIRNNEILIMDTDNVDTATKVWRWNIAGMGYSDSGYSGTFDIAVTMDGAFVADFITAGTLRAIDIEGVNISGSNFDSTSTEQKTEISDGVLSFFKKIGATWEPTARFNIIANSWGEYGAMVITNRWYGIGKEITGGVLIDYAYEPNPGSGEPKHTYQGGVYIDDLTVGGVDIFAKLSELEGRISALEA